MRIPVVVCSLVLVFAGAATAQSSRRDQMKKITADFESAQQAFYKKVGEAKTDDERTQIYEKEKLDPNKWATQLWALVDADGKDDVAADSLTWIATNTSDDNRKKAFKLLTENHIKAESIGELCTQLIYEPSAENEAFLRRVIDENPNLTAQGKACYSLAKMLTRAAEMKESLSGEGRASVEKYYGKATVEWLSGLDTGDLDADVEECFERCESDFADVEYMKGYKKLGEMAKGDLFEKRNLVIGKTAPEILGKDVDGTEFKLSDYRGKVVVIDFWGYW